jgi:hypothetical protein
VKTERGVLRKCRLFEWVFFRSRQSANLYERGSIESDAIYIKDVSMIGYWLLTYSYGLLKYFARLG